MSVSIGEAVLADAAAIGVVHVESWRAAYAGIVDDAALLGLRPTRLAAFYARRIGKGGVLVARQNGRVVGFASAAVNPTRFGAGEIETLYVAPDWQGRGIGRGLIRAAAAHLVRARCGSAFLWVLGANPNRFFYERMRGRLAGHGTTKVGGSDVAQVAYRWDPIDRLLDDPS